MVPQKVTRVGPALLNYVERLVEMGDAQNRASGHGPMFRRNMDPGNLSRGSSRLAGPWSRHRLGQKLFWGLKRCKWTSSTNAYKNRAAEAKTLTLAPISLSCVFYKSRNKISQNFIFSIDDYIKNTRCT